MIMLYVGGQTEMAQGVAIQIKDVAFEKHTHKHTHPDMSMFVGIMSSLPVVCSLAVSQKP